MTGAPPRPWSTRRARWTLNLYPPFLGSRVVVRHIAPDWRTLELTVERSLLNRNLNGTTFGGSIAAAVDPIHAILFWQCLAHRGLRSRAWTKSSAVQFLRPASSRVGLRFEIAAEEVEEAAAAVAGGGRFERAYEVEAVDRDGLCCARAQVVAHVRAASP